jgi:hypothetical protein
MSCYKDDAFLLLLKPVNRQTKNKVHHSHKPPLESKIHVQDTLWHSKQPGLLRTCNRLCYLNRRGYYNTQNNYEEKGNEIVDKNSLMSSYYDIISALHNEVNLNKRRNNGGTGSTYSK